MQERLAPLRGTPTLFLLAGEDEYVPSKRALRAFAPRLAAASGGATIIVPGANHEFHGHEGVATGHIMSFLLRLQRYGSFKTDGSHTSFLQVFCEGDELNRLYESLESALWERGFSKNRGRLTPHITLGRKIEGDEGFVLPPQKAAFTANTVVLYESRSERGQMVYTPIHREMLR